MKMITIRAMAIRTVMKSHSLSVSRLTGKRYMPSGTGHDCNGSVYVGDFDGTVFAFKLP